MTICLPGGLCPANLLAADGFYAPDKELISQYDDCYYYLCDINQDGIYELLLGIVNSDVNKDRDCGGNGNQWCRNAESGRDFSS